MARPAAVEALLDLLPAAGEPFPTAAREIWTRALSSILDITYGTTAPAQPAPAPTAEPAALSRPRGRPRGAKNKTGGPVTCELCGKTSTSQDGMRQHKLRNHGPATHVSGPPPRPAPTFTPTPAPEPVADNTPRPVTFNDRARERAAEAFA